MKKYFEDLLEIYANFAEKARLSREKVSLLQQNVDEFKQGKVEKLIGDENAAFGDYVEKQQKRAQEIAIHIMQQAEARDTTFDIAELNGIFSYLQATQKHADYKIVEKQLAAFRGCPQAIQAVLAVAENNECVPEVLGVVKSYNFDIDTISRAC